MFKLTTWEHGHRYPSNILEILLVMYQVIVLLERLSVIGYRCSAPMTGSNKTITGRNRLAALLSRACDLNSGSPVEI